MILDEIIERTKADLEIKKEITLDLLGKNTFFKSLCMNRDVKPYLTSTKEEPIRIIAEVKKAKSKQGNNKNRDFDPLLIAQAYSNSGSKMQFQF